MYVSAMHCGQMAEFSADLHLILGRPGSWLSWEKRQGKYL